MDKASGHLSVRDFKHVYLQIIRELGKRPQRKAACWLFKPGDLVPRRGVGGHAPVAMFDGCRQPLAGLQREMWRLQMCDCSQGPNLLRGGGIQSGSFSSSRTETGLFPRGLL